MRPQTGREQIRAALVMFLLALVAIASPRRAVAQADPSPEPSLLWTDPKTGEVFTKPGPGRVPFTAPGAPSNEPQLQEQIEQLQKSNAELSKQLAEIRPAWRDYLDNFKDKFRVGALFYFNWAYYCQSVSRDLPGLYRAVLQDAQNDAVGWLRVRILPYQGLPRDYDGNVPGALNGPLAAGAVALVDSEIDSLIERNALPEDRIPEGLAP